MDQRKIKSIIKNIDKHMKAVAKNRDNLDTFIDELEGLREDCRNAYDSLQEARDALSEMV